MGPYQLIYDYPLVSFGTQNRRFQSSWFLRFQWLEFSIEKESAFCFACYLFVNNSTQHDTFITKGFKNWKRVNCNPCPLSKDEGDDNSRHNTTMQKWQDLKNLSQHIDRRINMQSSKVVMQNRLLLKTSIESVK